MVLLQVKAWLLPRMPSTPKGQVGKLYVKTLPPIDANLAYHIRRAHYQEMLWKAADQQTRPAVDIAAYGWELVSGAGCVPTPRIARGPAAPPAVIHFQFRDENGF